MDFKLDVNLDFSNVNVDKTLPTISITQILGMLQEPFDKEGVAKKTYDKRFNDPTSEYYQKTVNEIIAMWEKKGADSCHYGSMLDDYIGANLTGTDANVKLFKLENNFDNDKRLQGLCESFDNFYKVMSKSGDTVFVDRERTIYHKVEFDDPNNPGSKITYYIKGRFDALFYNKRTKKWIIIDWKSSGSIDKIPNKWTKKLFAPMANYPALNWYTYTSQLYFYKHTLVDDGYLPKGTTYDDVIVMIVNLPGKNIEGTMLNYATHQAAFQFDPNLMQQLYIFGALHDYNERKDQINQTEELKMLEEIF